MTVGRGNMWRVLALQAGLIASAIVVGSGHAAAQDPLKVAAVFETPIEEPWVNQIHVALLRAKDEFGIEYTWSESVSASDFARVLSGYAEQGHGLIMGNSFGTERITRRVARDYPDVAFAFGSGIGPADPNFGVFDNWIHEPAYLAGMIAGKLTSSNVVGVVAAMPIPEVNRLSNAFCAGAKEVNEPVRCKFSFIGSFFDPPKAKEAAIAQIEAGVDVIYAERFGVIEAAAERGIPAVGNMSDQSELAPETVVTSVVWDMWPTVKQVISLVQADVFTAQDFGQFSFMGKGGSYLAPYHAWEDKLPDDVKAMVTRTHPGDHGRDLSGAGRREHAAVRIAPFALVDDRRSRAPRHSGHCLGCAGGSGFGLDIHEQIRSAARAARHRQALRCGARQSIRRPHSPCRRSVGAARRERRRQDHADEHPVRPVSCRCRRDPDHRPCGGRSGARPMPWPRASAWCISISTWWIGTACSKT